MKMTKEQFRAQWKHRINNGGLACNLEDLVFEGIMYNEYIIYRLFEKLVLWDNGEYYISSLP